MLCLARKAVSPSSSEVGRGSKVNSFLPGLDPERHERDSRPILGPSQVLQKWHRQSYVEAVLARARRSRDYHECAKVRHDCSPARTTCVK